MNLKLHAGLKVRHQGALAIVTRVRDQRLGGTLVDIRYLSGTWLGCTSTVRPSALDPEELPIAALAAATG